MKKTAKFYILALVYVQISFCGLPADARLTLRIPDFNSCLNIIPVLNMDGPGAIKPNQSKSVCDSLQSALQNLNTLIFWYEKDYIPAVQANIDRAPNSRDAKLQKPDLARAKDIVDSLKNVAKPKIQWQIGLQCGAGSNANPGTSKLNPAKNACDSLQLAIQSLNTLLSWYVQDYIPTVQTNINRVPNSRDAKLQKPDLERAKFIADSLKNKAIPSLQQKINKQCGQGTAANPGTSKSNPAKTKCDSLQQALQNLNTLIGWYVQDYIPAVTANINRNPNSRDAEIQKPQLERAKQIVDSLLKTAKPAIQQQINSQCGQGTSTNPGTSKGNTASKRTLCDSLQNAMQNLGTLIDWYDHSYIPALQANISRDPSGSDAAIQRPQLASAKAITDSLKNQAKPSLAALISKNCSNGSGKGPGGSSSGNNGNGTSSNNDGNGGGNGSAGGNGGNTNNSNSGNNGNGNNGNNGNGNNGNNGNGGNGNNGNAGNGNNANGNNGNGNNANAGNGINGNNVNGGNGNNPNNVNNPGGNGNANPGTDLSGSGTDNTGATHPGFGSSYSYTVDNFVTNLYVSKQTGEFTSFSGQGTKTDDQFSSGTCSLSTSGPIKYTLDPSLLSIGPSQTVTWKGKIMADVSAAPSPGYASPATLTGNYFVSYKTGGVFDPTTGKWTVEGHMVSGSGSESLGFIVYSVGVQITSDTVLCMADLPFQMVAQGFPDGGAFNWTSTDPNVNIVNFNGGNAIVNLVNNPGSGVLSVKYSVGGVSYTKTVTITSVNGPPDFYTPACVPDGTNTQGIVTLMGPAPRLTTILPATLNVPPGQAEAMIPISVTACGKTITHNIRVIRLPDFQLPCCVLNNTNTAGIVNYLGPVPAGTTVSPASIVQSGNSPFVTVTISCCGISISHQVAVLPDFKLPCCTEDGNQAAPLVTYLGPVPPGVTVNPQKLSTGNVAGVVPKMWSTQTVTVTCCAVSILHTIKVVDKTIQFKATPFAYDFKKAIDAVNDGAQKAQKVVDNVEKVVAKTGGCKPTERSAIPKISYSFTTNTLCCPEPNCDKQVYKGSLDVTFNFGKKKCTIPFVLLAVPMEAVFTAGLSGSVGGMIATTCAKDPQICFTGKLEGKLGGGIALGNSKAISLEGILEGSLTGQTNLCLDPSCFGGSVTLGKLDAIVTLNLTSFYSISGSYTLCSGFPPLKFGANPCP